MSIDEGLVQRVREQLGDRGDVQEKRMFGGLAFMVAGHMCCGVSKGRLMVRVGPDAHAAALDLPGAREMDFTGKPMRGFVFVVGDSLLEDEELAGWLQRGLAFVTGLPPKH